ncbi:YIP1 family protein [Flavobacterium sp.]|uniref:YIP1 family protein n=1 Tax=Flavobacterium sp. TaxID=239 RepID=UPI00286E6D4F|nr:YIP1 family protein [Flavobacterium sp.]
MKQLFFNPFEKYNSVHLLAIGVFANILGTFLFFLFNVNAIGFMKIQFDGTISLIKTSYQSVVILLCLSVVLFIIGKIINSKTRFIDILNTSLFAKIPLYLVSFSNINDYMYNSSESLKTMIVAREFKNITVTDFPILPLFAIASLALLIWAIVLLYNGFKTATNFKKTNHKIYFAIAVFMADYLSRILISQLA